MHALGDRVRNGVADAAADHAHTLEPFHVGGAAERSDKVCDLIAGLQQIEHLGGLTDRLDHDGNGALFAVIARDGNGNTLAILVQPENDKLAGKRLARDQRGLNDELDDGLRLVEGPLADDFEHIYPPKDVLGFCSYNEIITQFDRL